MGKDEFNVFLQRQAEKKQSEEPVDWEQVKAEWLAHIDTLYGMIREWLQEYVDDGRAVIQEEQITLHEEQLGSYQAKRLSVKVASEMVIFSPVARIILGGMGRVDMEGSAGKVKLILVDKKTTLIKFTVRIVAGGRETAPKKPDATREVEPTWKISTPPPDIKLIELNEESFYPAFMEVING